MPNVAEKLSSESQCRLCRRSAKVRKLTKHRVVPGRLPWRGKYHFENVIPLCDPCHRSVERHEEWRRMLRLAMWPLEVAYGMRLMGDDFDRMYPLRGAKLQDREKLDYIREDAEEWGDVKSARNPIMVAALENWEKLARDTGLKESAV